MRWRWLRRWGWLRNWCKNFFGFYDIRDLTVGGHCGCCGAWVPNAIVEKGWEWTLCDKCAAF